MKVVLLGTAAGGGYPQWNCACQMCAVAGTAAAPARTQDCAAVSADGRRWYLLNASPDIRAQILATPALRPRPPRDSPVGGVLLTDAELDHSLGLLMLREAAGGLDVHAPDAAVAALRDGFPVRGIVDSYGGWTWQAAGDSFDLDGLRATVLPVGDKRPKYARDLDAVGPWVVAYRISDPATGGSFVYAPCLAAWPDGFDDLLDGAGYALIDGTFFSPDEMSGATASGVSSAAQRRMGHIPIAGDDGSLARIAEHPGVTWAYTHLNNTNPVLDTSSPEYATVSEAGVRVPLDGTEIAL